MTTHFPFRRLVCAGLASAVASCSGAFSLGGESPTNGDGVPETTDGASALRDSTTLPFDAGGSEPPAYDAGNSSADSAATAPASEVLFNCGRDHTPYGIAVDSQHIFWAMQYLGFGGCLQYPNGNIPPCTAIMRANLDGSNVTIIAHDEPSVVFPLDVVLFGDDVYWDNTGSVGPIPVDGSLYGGLPAVARCPKAGCSGTAEALPYLGPFTYASGIAVGDAGVFWSGDYSPISAPKAGREVWRIDTTDGGASGPILGESNPPAGVAVGAIDGDHLYFGAPGDAVGAIGAGAPFVASDAGVAPLTLVATGLVPTGSHPGIFGVPHVAVDATNIYYVGLSVDGLTPDSGIVGTIPKSSLADGGAAQILASGLQYPLRVVVDDSNVYWTVMGPSTRSDAGQGDSFPQGSVMTCPKTGCGAAGPRVLATGLRFVTLGQQSGYLAVDANYVYLTVDGDGTVRRVAK